MPWYRCNLTTSCRSDGLSGRCFYRIIIRGSQSAVAGFQSRNSRLTFFDVDKFLLESTDVNPSSYADGPVSQSGKSVKAILMQVANRHLMPMRFPRQSYQSKAALHALNMITSNTRDGILHSIKSFTGSKFFSHEVF
jgi:hypothetical protein